VSAPRSLLLAALAVVLAACSTPGPDVAASVGDVRIGLPELETRAAVYRVVGELSGQPCGAPEEGETDESACNRFALSQLIQSEISAGYARSHEIRVDAQEAEDAVVGFETGVGERELRQALAEQGVARADVIDLVSDLLLTRDVGAAVAEEQLGDQALRDAYEEDLARFTTVRVAHILVATQAEAQDVWQKVTADGATPRTFARFARQVSLDTGSAPQGGELGSAVASTYVPEFAAAAIALHPGEISAPVQTQFGWHVIRLDEAQVTSFQDAKPQLLQELGAERFLSWLRARARQLEVEVNPRFGRLDPQTVTVVRISSTGVGSSPASSAEAAPTGP
jgi:hypothetical protein